METIELIGLIGLILSVAVLCITIAVMIYDKLAERKHQKDMETLRKFILGRYDKID